MTADPESPASAFGSIRRWWANIRLEWSVYFWHVLGLVRPGRGVPSFTVHRNMTGDLRDWGAADFDLLIEQGRAQIARQRTDLEQTRGRAQFLFTTGLGVSALAMAALPHVAASLLAYAVWGLGLLVTLISMLGAAAIVVVRKDFRDIDTALVSLQNPPVNVAVAKAYAASVSEGENTVATQVTNLRNAVAALLVSLVILGTAWMFAAR